MLNNIKLTYFDAPVINKNINKYKYNYIKYNFIFRVELRLLDYVSI